MFDMFMTAFSSACSLEALVANFIGVALGIVFGALPGLTAVMGVALLIPLTFGFPAVIAFSSLLGMYCGAIYAGSITAILVGTPGTAAAAATMLEGPQFTARGESLKALEMTTIASFIGGIFSCLVLATVAPQLAHFALDFSAPEYFSLGIFGLTIVATLSEGALLKGCIAALLGMLPKGLVLLISVSLATGVIRLAKAKILVQNIYSLETLAHVDVLCLDKTGTLTDGNMSVDRIVPLGERGAAEDSDALLRAYLDASEDNNVTIAALRAHFGADGSTADAGQPAAPAGDGRFAAQAIIPFSSKRKWGAITMRAAAGAADAPRHAQEGESAAAATGTVFLGAPERILGANLPDEAAALMGQGLRLIAVGYLPGAWTDEERLPDALQPMFLIALRDNIRPRAKETLAYFRDQGVDVKVISGDHPDTVAAVARQAGLERWRDVIDMTSVPADAPDSTFDDVAGRYTVFSRVTPKQKRQLVQAMQRAGHQVAMTGDGVNDLLALREADCSIAIASGSDAARQISQVVLLDSDFTYLPQVVLEGRKVVNTVTRKAAVFFIKTIYSVLVSFFCLALNVPFPFIPIQITLVDACIEAWPSFLTIFESDTRRIRGRFLPTALGKAAPFAIAVTGMIIAFSLIAPFGETQNRTVMFALLVAASMVAVIKSCVPFTKIRVFVCVTMVLGAPFALLILPHLFEVVAMTGPMWAWFAVAFVVMTAVTAAIIAAQRAWLRSRR